jgi:transketolase
VVSESAPTKVLSISIKNRFGQSGDPAELLKEYHLAAADIEKAALQSIS